MNDESTTNTIDSSPRSPDDLHRIHTVSADRLIGGRIGVSLWHGSKEELCGSLSVTLARYLAKSIARACDEADPPPDSAGSLFFDGERHPLDRLDGRIAPSIVDADYLGGVDGGGYVRVTLWQGDRGDAVQAFMGERLARHLGFQIRLALGDVALDGAAPAAGPIPDTSTSDEASSDPRPGGVYEFGGGVWTVDVGEAERGLTVWRTVIDGAVVAVRPHPHGWYAEIVTGEPPRVAVSGVLHHDLETAADAALFVAADLAVLHDGPPAGSDPEPDDGDPEPAAVSLDDWEWDDEDAALTLHGRRYQLGPGVVADLARMLVDNALRA